MNTDYNILYITFVLIFLLGILWIYLTYTKEDPVAVLNIMKEMFNQKQPVDG